MSNTDTHPETDATGAAPAPEGTGTRAGGAADAAGGALPGAPSQEEFAKAIADRDAALAEAQSQRELQLRTLADFDNFRRRVQRDKEEVRAIAVGKVLEDLIPVYDTLSIALQSLKGSADPATISKGIEMVQGQFRLALERNGIAEIAPAPGADFDPNRHESIAAQPHAEIPEGKVSTLFRAGFAAGTRVLRPASVVLSSGPAAS